MFSEYLFQGSLQMTHMQRLLSLALPFYWLDDCRVPDLELSVYTKMTLSSQQSCLSPGCWDG